MLGEGILRRTGVLQKPQRRIRLPDVVSFLGPSAFLVIVFFLIPIFIASGLEKGDVIVGVDGRTGKLSAPKFQAYLRVQHSTPTTTARMTVLRNGERREIEVRFFE